MNDYDKVTEWIVTFAWTCVYVVIILGCIALALLLGGAA